MPQSSTGKGKGKLGIAVFNQPHCYGNSLATWDNTVLSAIPAN